MGDFTLGKRTAEGSIIFTFNRIYTTRGIIYFVSAAGYSTNTYFQMVESSGIWKIVLAPKPPDWVLQHEEELARAISSNQN